MSLEERHEQILDRCIDSLKTWKDLITEFIDDDACVSEEINKLKTTTESFCSINQDFKKSLRALQKTEEQLNENEENSMNVEQLYKENLQNDAEPETADDYTNSDIWQRVFRGISDVMEVTHSKKKLKDSEFEELDDSLFCSNVFTPPLDPLSKAVIRDPVRNSKCKHVYERALIVDYIKQQKRKARCPYMGCTNRRMLMSDIVDDLQLQSQITQYIENHEDEDASD